jgi:hypothetical protein
LKRDELSNPGRCAETEQDLVALNGVDIEFKHMARPGADAE